MCFIASICQYEKDFLSSIVEKQKVGLLNTRPLKNISLKQVRVTLCSSGTNKTKRRMKGKSFHLFKLQVAPRGHAKAKLSPSNILALSEQKLL